jgi:hypothetical protein
LDKTGQRQHRHIANIGIGEMTMPTHRQHGGKALQIQIPLLNWYRSGGIHNGSELIVGETQHAAIMPRRRRFSSQPVCLPTSIGFLHAGGAAIHGVDTLGHEEPTAFPAG